MHYSHPQIVFQEVPGHISLALSISGCTLGCKGCHSTDAWAPAFGDDLTDAVLLHLINRYRGMISNVLFYGGEWEAERLIELLTLVNRQGLAATLYTGRERHELDPLIIEQLHFLKTGRYVATLGGLDSQQTNQRFFDLKHGIDITASFAR